MEKEHNMINDLLDAIGLTALFTHFAMRAVVWISGVESGLLSSYISIVAGLVAIVVGIMRGYDYYLTTKERKREIRKRKEEDDEV